MIRRWSGLAITFALLVGLAAFVGPAGAEDDVSSPSVVEILLPDRAALDRLVETGVDLAHQIDFREDGIVAQVVVTEEELADLAAEGFVAGQVLFTPADAAARLAERAATIERHRQADASSNSRFGKAAAADTDTVKLLRADYFTSLGAQYINVEAKSSMGSLSSTVLTVSWDSGPNTAMGSGGTINLQRFVDVFYMYHRRQIPVTKRPSLIQVVSSAGGSAGGSVVDWLVPTKPNKKTDVPFKDFVDHYMDPTELDARIEQLHAEFPELTDLVELPNRSNGYRRKAQAILGATSPTSQQASAVVATSKAYGSEGGNDVWVELKNPGAADQPLSVSALANYVLVSLATNAAGAPSSTAAQVVAAIDASLPSLLDAHTYRGNAGAGIVQPRAATKLSDFLDAPPTISRDPFPIRMLRIGKVRDGSKLGVLVYAQEHAREWVPPLVTVEVAERLLRNYAVDSRTRQFLNNLEVFVIPSVNPDGSHYSFYDDTGQRKNMTNYCPDPAADPNRRNDWGVDNNRNYPFGSLFDGYSGASTDCRSDVFAGPAEASEPENKNVVSVPTQHPSIRFSMNIHSSGNYFMWSPGSYKLPTRELLPRPDLGVETYFWGASAHILTEIRKHRDLAVTPARTGPIADVLYSAAGNSGDYMYYVHNLFAWNFEVGNAGFQPAWTEAHEQLMEFANGVYGLLDVAYAYKRDWHSPDSKIVTEPGAPGTVSLRFESDEPAMVFYTLDGSRPTTASTRYASSGTREGPQTLTLTQTTTVSWFSVDMAGNIENAYKPDGLGAKGKRFNKQIVTVP